MSVLNWYDLVANYSGKRLTFASDKLPAISAIAQAVIKCTGASYAAGLWEHEMIDELLWTRWQDLQSNKKTADLETSGSPTWSWAAYDGAVSTGLCREIDVETKFATMNCVKIFPLDPKYDTGPVLGGVVTLSGPYANICFNDHADRSLSGVEAWGYCESQTLFNFDLVTVVFDLASEEQACTPALCIAMRRTSTSSGIACLAVRPDPDSDGSYVRVGAGSIWPRDPGTANLSDRTLQSPPRHMKTVTIN